MPEVLDEDAQLMLAFAGGDAAAFDRLFDRWSGRLLHFLERMVRDRAVAEELLQESFLRVHRARERYRPEGRFSTWLYTIASNAARNELRRPFRRSPHQSTDAEPEHAPALQLVADAPGAEELADARRRGDAVDAGLAELPPRQRAALWLAAVEGLSYAEVAAALDTTEKSVKSLVHRGRVALAKQLEAQGLASETRTDAQGARR